MAETIIANPTAVEFTSLDHASATGYIVEALDESDVVVKTLNFTTAQTTVVAAGRIHIDINVMNLKPFGIYRTRVVLVAGPVLSPPSYPSPDWERKPGQPSEVFML